MPLNGIASGELGALLTSVTLPLRFPADAGEKPTVKVAESPVATESGTVRPDKVKPAPEIVACEMLSGAEPGF